MAHKFGQSIDASPTVYFSMPRILTIPDSDKIIAVFHIPQSPERPHLPSKEDCRTFWKRTNKGNDYMTYEEVKMAFENYEERREKLKLLYIELLYNMEQLRSMKIDDSSKENVHSLMTLDSTIINSLLTDLYTIIGRDTELIRILFTIRQGINIINNKVRIFFMQVALPTMNKNQLVKEHNEIINKNVDYLIPFIARAIGILEKKFSLTNPLQE
jgi:hypothetical protein